jgi:hypothetical protein
VNRSSADSHERFLCGHGESQIDNGLVPLELICRRQSFHFQTSRGSRRKASDVASCSSRKRRHRPPLPRNVGMAAEMPVPVRTVMRRAEAIRWPAIPIAD